VRGTQEGTGGARQQRGGRPCRAVPTAPPTPPHHATPLKQETPVPPLTQGGRAGEQQGARTAPSRARQIFKARARRERGHIFAGVAAEREQPLTRARLMSLFALRELKYSARHLTSCRVLSIVQTHKVAPACEQGRSRSEGRVGGARTCERPASSSIPTWAHPPDAQASGSGKRHSLARAELPLVCRCHEVATPEVPGPHALQRGAAAGQGKREGC
jgi:hypothetical protein